MPHGTAGPSAAGSSVPQVAEQAGEHVEDGGKPPPVPLKEWEKTLGEKPPAIPLKERGEARALSSGRTLSGPAEEFDELDVIDPRQRQVIESAPRRDRAVPAAPQYSPPPAKPQKTGWGGFCSSCTGSLLQGAEVRADFVE